ncbi:MAG TPA: hypothetical protein VF857_03040 [Spirochaetota bacterium]
MSQSEDSAKASTFITNLLNSPNMKNENIFVAETMIHTFIAQNKIQLGQTLRNPQYFPHLDPNDAIKLIISELFSHVKTIALEPIDKFLDGTDFSVLGKIPDAGQFPGQYHRDMIRSFIQAQFKLRDVRANFSSTYNIFTYGILERYLNEIFQRRDFIYNELVRVQKTYLEVDEYIIYLKVLLLMKGIIYIKVPLNDAEPERKYTLAEVAKIPGKIPAYLSMLARELSSSLPNLPERTVHLAVKANLSDTMTSLDEGSSRLLYVLCARFHNYKPMTKIDRGAESPDKSWFSIARKNARVFGFEKNMLEELYRIAGDNNW